MRILDLLKKDLLKKNPFSRQLSLDDAQMAVWPQQVVEHTGLDSDFKGFLADVKERTEAIAQSLRSFSDEEVLSAIPDRARTMNALHGNEYASQVQKLLKTVTFTGLFAFEKEQDAYFEANSAFKDQTAKNVAVLKEFMHDEIKATQELLQGLEDRIIGFSKTLEEKRFPQIRKMHELNTRLQQTSERAEKYEKLLASLQADLKRTQEKRAKLEEEIAAQRSLVRNTESLAALEKMKRTDEELHKLAVQYAGVCQDARSVYKKHPQFELPPKVKHVLDELPKDPLHFISQNAEAIKSAFEEIIAQFEEERPGNTRTIIERLTRLGGLVEQDSRTIATAQPDLRALKREMMKDIAALNMYDKRQFLLRAQTEEETIQTKIAYLQAELDPQKRLAIQREIKDLAHALGAIVMSEPEQGKVGAPEQQAGAAAKESADEEADDPEDDGPDDDSEEQTLAVKK